MEDIVKSYKKKTIIFSSIGGALFLAAVIFLIVTEIVYRANSEVLESYVVKNCNLFLVLAVLFALTALPFLIIGLTVFFRKLQNARQELADNPTQK